LTLSRKAKKNTADFLLAAELEYKEALKLVLKDLSPVNPVRLSTVLNYSILLFNHKE
jgi:hypothetical protein